MRIGIDAKWFFDGPVSNQIVIRSMVEHLILENPGHELIFFLNRKHKLEPFPFYGAQVKLIYVWADINLISNVLMLPFYGKSLKLDCILFQNFGSFFGPKRFIYIHDVIFLAHPQYFTVPERIYFAFIPILANWANRIITISKIERNRILSHKVGKGCPVDVVYHSVDQAFKPKTYFLDSELNRTKKQYGLPDRYILFVGRLNLRKNLSGLLKAFYSISDTSVSLVIVGEQEWKPDPEVRLAQIDGEPNRVILTGKMPFEDLTKVYSMATCFCFPSHAEGFGLPVLEAMSAGVPVLTSRNTAMEEICAEAGVYFDSSDPMDIAAKIQLVLNDENKQKEMSDYGLKRAKYFSWTKTAHELFALFNSLLIR